MSTLYAREHVPPSDSKEKAKSVTYSGDSFEPLNAMLSFHISDAPTLSGAAPSFVVEDYPSCCVCVNIYDLIEWNECLYAFGLGIHHVGIQVYGMEFAYGYTPSGTGVVRCVPGFSPPHMWREQLSLGLTRKSREEVMEGIGRFQQSLEWNGSAYRLLSHNCIHFVEAFLDFLKPQKNNNHIAPLPPLPSVASSSSSSSSSQISSCTPRHGGQVHPTGSPSPPPPASSSSSASSPNKFSTSHLFSPRASREAEEVEQQQQGVRSDHSIPHQNTLLEKKSAKKLSSSFYGAAGGAEAEEVRKEEGGIEGRGESTSSSSSTSSRSRSSRSSRRRQQWEFYDGSGPAEDDEEDGRGGGGATPPHPQHPQPPPQQHRSCNGTFFWLPPYVYRLQELGLRLLPTYFRNILDSTNIETEATVTDAVV